MVTQMHDASSIIAECLV